MNDISIGFIGGGNMARSLIGGLLADGCPAANLCVAEPDAAAREAVAAGFGVHTGADNLQVAGQCQVVVLAVKPQVIRAVAEEIGPVVRANGVLVISVAAGIRLVDLQRWLGGHDRLVRCMPNTPALVQSGATALFALDAVDETRRNLAESILRAAGLTLWLEDEGQMDAVTALSGSGPAYHFLVMEAMESAGIKLGLSPEAARLLSVQTAFGAARMALESPEDPAVLRQRVTSPGGTTERAVAILEEGGLHRLFHEAMQAAHDRAVELAEALGKD